MNISLPRRFATALLAIAAALVSARSADAQVLGGRLGQRLAERRAQLQQGQETVAVAGMPFGVARVTIPSSATGAASATDERAIVVTEKNGRAFYAATLNRPVRAALREILDKELAIQIRSRATTVYFLFQGSEPLDLTLFAPAAMPQRIVPQQDPARHAQLLAEWWKEYSGDAERVNRNDEYPHVADVYLTGMLAQRLSLQPPSFRPRLLSPKLPDVEKTFGLLLGTEQARLAVARETMTTQAPVEAADQPVPPALQIPQPNIPDPPADVVIEPIAMHVPQQWLYVRYGSFNNYQWFRKTLDEWGGDLRNLITLRGLDYNINARLERQLSLRESPLAPLLGPTVMADVALVGDDPFLREGAAIGMLFQARSNFALASDFRQQRAETLAREKDATEQKLQIGGHEVSFLSTPDNRIRSFYAVDGDFHLVCSSRKMVEQFYGVAAGLPSLGQARDFRHARAERKPDPADQVFVYLSAAFFQQLASPQYQIEMTRRLRSTTDIELLELARWAARNEGKQAPTLGDLTSGGFLPANFGGRADGSRLEELVGGQVTDMVRGGRGSFLPIPDVQLTQVTRSEAAAYARFAESFNESWGQMGPTSIAMRRTDAGNGRDQMAIAVRTIPLAAKSNFLADRLGPPDGKHIEPVAGDVVAIDAVVNGSLQGMFNLGGGAPAQPYHLFAGVRGGEIPQGAGQSGILPFGLLPHWRYYVGAWPVPGLLTMFGAGNPATPVDANGFTQAGGFWQRQMGQMTVISPQSDLLAEVTPALKMVSAPDDAQLFLHVGDLTSSKLAGMANQFGYSRARTIAFGNTHYLESLTTQLGVPPQKARDVAERLADARLVSPLGGGYELVSRGGGFPTWIPTALKNETVVGLFPTPPADFQSPPLNWFRGLELTLKNDPGKLLAVNSTVQMQRPAPPPESSRSEAAPSETTPKTPSPPAPERIEPGQSSLQRNGP
jgi:hypothetical protein